MARRHGSRSDGDAIAQLVASYLPIVGADAAFLGLLSHDRRLIEVMRVTRYSSRPARMTFPVDAPYPLAAAIREAKQIFIGSNGELACEHPGLVRVVADDHACATVPVVGENGRVIGALNLAFEDPRTFSDGERELIAEVAGQVRERMLGFTR